jgi:hypothetical protein
MDGDPQAPIAALVVVVLAAWTLWTLNAGRRMARWGRRKLLRLALLLGLVALAAVVLTSG